MAEIHVRAEVTIAESSSKLVRSSAADRSGKSRARPVLDAHVGGAKFAERPVKVAAIQGDNPLGRRGTRIRERRALTGVVAASSSR